MSEDTLNMYCLGSFLSRLNIYCKHEKLGNYLFFECMDVLHVVYASIGGYLSIKSIRMLASYHRTVPLYFRNRCFCL